MCSVTRVENDHLSVGCREVSAYGRFRVKRYRDCMCADSAMMRNVFKVLKGLTKTRQRRQRERKKKNRTIFKMSN